jgi:hypothetical protein
VYAIAIQGSTVFVGGDFTAALVNGKLVGRQRLAAFDAQSGVLLPWAPAADKVVRAIAIADTAVWVAGDFQLVNGVSRDSLARLDASTGQVSPVQHKISGGAPRTLGVGHGRLYMAGLFTGVDNAIRSNVAAFDLGTGELSGWAPTTDDVVESMSVTDTRIYLGGSFHRTNDISSTGRLIAVRPDGTVDLAFRPQPAAVVHAIATTGSRVYAALGGQGGRTIAYTTGGKADWTVTTDGDVQALTVLGGTVYHGGHFDNVCLSNRTADHGVCLDGSLPRVKLFATDTAGTVLSWAPTANGIRGVLALAAAAGVGVAAGGEFTTIDGATQKRFALFN